MQVIKFDIKLIICVFLHKIDYLLKNHIFDYAAVKKCNFSNLKTDLNQKGQIWAEVICTKTNQVPWPVTT